MTSGCVTVRDKRTENCWNSSTQAQETVPVVGNCNSSHVSIPLMSLFIYYINWLPLQGLTQPSSHKSIPVKVSTVTNCDTATGHVTGPYVYNSIVSLCFSLI